MDILEEKLTTLGLSEREAAIYLLLLKYGNKQTSFIAEKAQLNRGTTYQALHSLLERGLIAKSVQGKTQFFTALAPTALFNYVARREEELKHVKKTASEIVPELESLSLQTISKPTVQYFTGVDGVRNALEDTLTAKEDIIRGYTSHDDLDAFIGAEYFSVTYTSKRIEKGYKLQSIQSLLKDKKAMTRENYIRSSGTCAAANREVRYIHNDLAFPMSMRIYDDKVLVISSKEENFALITQSSQYAEMQKKIFYELWNSLTPGQEQI